MTPLQPSASELYDVVGIGFGPSNIALAVALFEHNASVPVAERLTYRFVEKQPTLAWHPNMLIDGTTMQISFLKDLVTPRNPASHFSFVSYLHEKNRLAAFTNHKTLFPSRAEFHDYLEWAAAKLGPCVTYGHEVHDIRPAARADDSERAAVREVEVRARPTGGDGQAAVLRARNVVLATGLTPQLPPGLPESERIWHSDDFLRCLASFPGDAAATFVVVGAGQSAAEVVDCLHGQRPRSQVHSVFSRYGYSPADDSAFVNGIFDQEAVAAFFHATAEAKEQLLDYHRNTNYSVADEQLIDALYRRHYQELVSGERRLHIQRMSRVAEVRPVADRVEVAIESLSGEAGPRISADAVIYATGYRATDPLLALGSLAALCKRDANGQPRVDLHHRVDTTDSVRCGIFVQGATESSHGLSTSLLSNVASRAGQIVSSVLAGGR